MIVDRLERLECYAGLGRYFAAAAAFVKNNDLYALPLGRTDVDGDNVFINVFENVYDREDMFWEAHRRYADVQVILKGRERFGWGHACAYGQLTGDLMECSGVQGFDFVVEEGQFALFLPPEPHSPGNPAGGGGPCRKAVIKVLAE